MQKSTGIRDDGTAPTRTRALKILRAKVKVADTPAFVAPSAAKLTFEDLWDLLVADYRRKENRTTKNSGRSGRTWQRPLRG